MTKYEKKIRVSYCLLKVVHIYLQVCKKSDEIYNLSFLFIRLAHFQQTTTLKNLDQCQKLKLKIKVLLNVNVCKEILR